MDDFSPELGFLELVFKSVSIWEASVDVSLESFSFPIPGVETDFDEGFPFRVERDIDGPPVPVFEHQRRHAHLLGFTAL